MNLQEKKISLLEDTVEYYSVDSNRLCKFGKLPSCYYSPITAQNPHSNGCAIGRLVSPKLRIKLDEAKGTVSEIFDLLPKKIKHFGVDFLAELQFLHDFNENWEKTKGLTAKGKRRVETIKKQIEDGIL